MKTLNIISFLVFICGYGHCCNLSSVTMTNFTVNPDLSCQITMDLCIGAGRTGATSGADGSTMDLVIGIYAPYALNILSFSPNDTPPYLESSYTQCELPGFDVGPIAGDPFNTQATLYYMYDPFTFPSCTNGFTCVSTTANCGNVHMDCFTITVTLDAVPDSIRVFGAEGAGNPTASCTFNQDMLIDLATYLNVDWGDLNALAINEREINVEWETHSETDNDFFTVLRLIPEAHSWEPIGYMDGNGTTNEVVEYSFVDTYPAYGVNYYRIQQTDFNGVTTKSKIFTANLEPESFVWEELYPNPVKDELTLNGMKNKTVSILDSRGIVIETITISSNWQEIGVEMLENGAYFLHIADKDGSTSYRSFIVSK